MVECVEERAVRRVFFFLVFCSWAICTWSTSREAYHRIYFL